MRPSPRYRQFQPAAAARRSDSVFVAPSPHALLWQAEAPLYDGITGQTGSFGSPSSIVPVVTSPGRGLSFGDSTTASVIFPNRLTTATRWTFGMVVVPRVSASTQVQFWSNTGTGAGLNFQITSAGTTFQISKAGISTFGATTLTVGVPYWIRGSHDEGTDEFWIIATSLLDGSIVTTTGTDVLVEIAGDGTWNVGGRSDAGTTSSNSELLALYFDTEFFTPLAMGYAWDNPWEMFEPVPDVLIPTSAGLTVNAAVGNAVAAGSTAAISLGTTVNALVGNAVANGSTAAISLGTTVNATVGNAVAQGLDASIQLGGYVNAGIGDAVAAGLTAGISLGLTITAGVGAGQAIGWTATITTDVGLGFIGGDLSFGAKKPRKKVRKAAVEAKVVEAPPVVARPLAPLIIREDEILRKAPEVREPAPVDADADPTLGDILAEIKALRADIAEDRASRRSRVRLQLMLL